MSRAADAIEEIVSDIILREPITTASAVEFVISNKTELVAAHMFNRTEMVQFLTAKVLDGYEILGALLLDSEGQFGTAVFGLLSTGEAQPSHDALEQARSEILSFKDSFLRRCMVLGERMAPSD
jgi:hypothetical protein